MCAQLIYNFTKYGCISFFKLFLLQHILRSSGQGISHYIIFAFDMPDVQVIFLQGQTPPH